MTLKDAHFHGVKVINPILTKKYQKSSIRKIKTDAVDAKVLAQMGKMEKLASFDVDKDGLLQKKRITLLKKLEHIHQQLGASLREFRESSATLKLDEKEPEGMCFILESIEREMKALQTKIIENENTSLSHELAKVKGISKQNAAIMSFFFAKREFASRDQITAFAGLDLTVRESGTSIHGRRKLSKRGDSFLRKKIFQSAWGVAMHNPVYKAYYQKKRAEGHHYYTCLIAVSRKLLRHILYLKKQMLLQTSV
jgi:transposase